MSVMGALLGLMGACAVALLASWTTTLRAPDVTTRIAPFVPALREHARRPVRADPSLARIRDLAEGWMSQSPSRGSGTGERRLEQLAWAGCGGAIGAVTGLAAVSRGASPVVTLLMATIGATAGALALDRRESARLRERRSRIDEELPTVAELLAFAVAAGEPLLVAMERVAGIVRGELADAIDGVSSERRAGASTNEALRSLADRCGTPDSERFVDGILVALERGTPIVDVLRAQAADARAAQRRRLMEIAGRKDITMLMPVVFLILPTVIVIALFPGYRALQVLGS